MNTITATVFDINTGLIKRVITVPENMLGINIHDGESHVFDKPSDGDTHYINGEFIGPSQADLDAIALQQAWLDFRYQRDILLSSSDWTQVADAPVDQEAWKVYRQILRDLPNSITDPTNVTWPEQP